MDTTESSTFITPPTSPTPSSTSNFPPNSPQLESSTSLPGPSPPGTAGCSSTSMPSVDRTPNAGSSPHPQRSLRASPSMPVFIRAPSSSSAASISISKTSATGSGTTSSSKSNPTPVQTFPDDESLVESLKLATSTQPARASDKDADMVHPFANSTAKLELLPNGHSTTAHGIDIEEEARLYDDLLTGAYEDQTDEFSRTNTPVGRARTRPQLNAGMRTGEYEDETDEFSRTNTPVGRARIHPQTQGRSRTLSHPTPSAAGPSKLQKPKPKPSLDSLAHHGYRLTPAQQQQQQRHHTLPRSGLSNSSSSNSYSYTDSSSPVDPAAYPSNSNPELKSHPTWPYTPYTSSNTRPKGPPRAESIFSADIYLADNTTTSGSPGYTPDSTYARGHAQNQGQAHPKRRPPPPLFAQDVRIDGWVVVGDGAGAAHSTFTSASGSTTPSSPLSPTTPGIGPRTPTTPNTPSFGSSPSPGHGLHLGKSKVASPSLRKVVSNGAAGAYVVYDCVIVLRDSDVDVADADAGSADADADLGQRKVDENGGCGGDVKTTKSKGKGTTMRILKRYSAFEELREELRRGLEPNLLPLLPPLPPKAPLARFRPAFLEKRRGMLEEWLARVMLHPDVGGRGEVRRWVLDLD